jgi:hypothetical protein
MNTNSSGVPITNCDEVEEKAKWKEFEKIASFFLCDDINA